MFKIQLDKVLFLLSLTVIVCCFVWLFNIDIFNAIVARESVAAMLEAETANTAGIAKRVIIFIFQPSP